MFKKRIKNKNKSIQALHIVDPLTGTHAFSKRFSAISDAAKNETNDLLLDDEHYTAFDSLLEDIESK